MEVGNTSYKISKVPYIYLLAGLSIIAIDTLYIILYGSSLPADMLSAFRDKIQIMLEYVWASVALLTGGVLLFDYEIKVRKSD